MPPQPLSSVRREAKVIADPAAVRRYPALGAAVAEIIALWSRIDSTLSLILAHMLRAGVRTSVAMYDAILNSQAQMAALEAAARSSLNKDDFLLFGAVMTLVKRAGAKRHKAAHWIWGYSPEIPDALVLIDPDAIIEFNVAQKELLDIVMGGGQPQSRKLDTSRAFVYRAADFIEITNELRNVLQISINFALTVNAAPGGAQLRAQLLALPQIQEALKRKV